MARTDQRAVPLVLIAIAVALIAARTVSHFVNKPNAALVHWVSLEEGAQLAQGSNKPVLLFFTAEWCGPCHMLESEVFSQAEVARAINERVIPIRITDRKREEGRNAPLVEQLEQRYAVRGFPTLVFVDGNGAERARMEGFRPREEFERVLESIR